jgi:thioredoxin 1
VISPKYEEFSNKYGDKATFLKVDVDEVADVAEMAGIRAMPTFHFYKKGQKVGEVVGADVKQLEEKIKTLSA